MFKTFSAAACLAVSIAAPAAGWADGEWVYAADTSTNIIYGFPLETLGKTPAVPISGNLAISADHVANLNEHELLFVPSGTKKIAWLDLDKGQVQEVGTFAGKPLSFERHEDGNGATMLVAGPADSDINLVVTEREAPDGKWTTALITSPAPFSVGGGWAVRTGPDQWAVLVHAGAGADQELVLVQRTGELTVIESLGGEYARLVSLPGGGFAALGAGVPAREYAGSGTYTGLLGLNPVIESERLETIRIGTGSPRAVAVLNSASFGRGSFAMQDSTSTESITLLQPPFDAGGTPVNLLGARALYPAGSNQWHYHDDGTGTINRFDSATKKISTFFSFSRGTGPQLEGIKAITSGPDGILYVLDDALTGFRIVRINPSTGNRNLLAEVSAIDLMPTIACSTPGRVLLLESVPDLRSTSSLPENYRLVEVDTTVSPVAIERGDLHAIHAPAVDFSIEPSGIATILAPSPEQAAIYRITSSGMQTGPAPIPLDFVSGAWDPRENWFTGTYHQTAPLAGSTGFLFSGMANANFALSEAPGRVDIIRPDSSASEVFVPQSTGFGTQGAEPTYYAFSDFMRHKDQSPGDWQVTIRFDHTRPDSTGLMPMDMKLNLLGDVQTMVEGAANPVALRKSTLELFTLADDLGAVTDAKALGHAGIDPAYLRQASDIIALPDGDYLSVTGEGWRFFKTAAATGETVLLGSTVPNIIDRELSGQSALPWIDLVIGRAPAANLDTGWVIK